MSQLDSITVQGQGVDALKSYFETLGNPGLGKIPPKAANWVDEARYDAPYGILTVWADGTWEATYRLEAVVSDIRRVPGLTITKGQ